MVLTTDFGGFDTPLACPRRRMSLHRSRLSLALIIPLLLVAGVLAWQGAARTRAVAQPPVYVALGASDAVGIGANRPEAEGWVPLVYAGLPADTRLVNLGVSGATLADVLAEQLPVARDAAPRWVTIWPGPNDLRNGVPLGAFSARLDTLLGQLAALRRPGQPVELVVLNLPDLRAAPAFAGINPSALDAEVRAWNAAIAAAASRHGATLVDLYATMNELAQHPEYISADGFHPSSAGYRRIADLALARIDRNVAAALR